MEHIDHRSGGDEKKLNRMKKVLPLFLAAIYVGLLICIFCENRYLQANRMIRIMPHENSGTITFRGAVVDDVWYNPQDILSSSDGWILQEEDNTLAAVSDHILELNLPIGSERALVFNIGPDGGSVNTLVNNHLLEWNFYHADQVDTGGFFQLPYIRFSNKLKLNIAAACVLAIFTGIMLVFNLYFRKTSSNTKKSTKERNASIEFLRFIIIILVMTHHYCNRPRAGYLGVDFFFLLSGFLLMHHYANSPLVNDSPVLSAVKYTRERYLRLIPYYILAFFLGIGLSACTWEGYSLHNFVENNLYELFMLEAFGFTTDLVVGPGWYCSALIIAGFCIYFLLGRLKETYLYFVAPLSLFIIFAWMNQNIGHLNRWLQYDTFISTGAIRGFAEMSLGCICYQIFLLLQKKCENRGIICSTALEFICFAYIMHVFFVTGSSSKDFVCVFVMAVFITSLFIGNSLWARVLNNRLSQYLGSISISIYLNHIMISKISWYTIGSFLNFSWNQSLLAYCIVVIVFSAISTRFVKNILRA